ncbi:hypothetical protein BgAZ_100630 [Babesia gibsoni]|uniref:Uncharacterized protein n=1 Tax=Babesia gibsoni TaxID=33632 RepID=A0AAD8PF08_BABGI|nr:hypothetical protein BgAZ_100630 [Babesia gibsoni]
MESSKAILLDVLNFLPLVEDRIVGKDTDVSDYSLDMLERMVRKCDKAVSVEDVVALRKRIDVARETVDILASKCGPTKCDSVFGDVIALSGMRQRKDKPDDNYAKCLNMSNEDFDNLIEDWATDFGKGSSNARNKRKNKASIGDQQEKIRSDLVKLADTMKSKALWYRDILVKDNEVLSKYTAEQEKQLDTVAHVASEASKLTKAAKLSLRQSIVMVVSMFFIILLMMMVFIVT